MSIFVNEYVEVCMVSSIEKEFRHLYKPKGKQIIRTIHLSRGSKIKVKMKCSKCGLVRMVKFQDIWNSTDFTGLCKSCSSKNNLIKLNKKEGSFIYGEHTDLECVEHMIKTSALYCDRKYKTIRKEVLKDKCEKCGGNHILNIHHILPVETNPELYYEPSNMVTLCNSCHTSYHNNYEPNINPETLEDFINGKRSK